MTNNDNRLRSLRDEKKYTQEYVASATGIGRGSLSSYENGLAPTVQAALTLADFYGVTVDYIVGHSSERKPADGKLGDEMMELNRLAPEDSITSDSISRLLESAISYYNSGAPAGSAPMNCIKAFLSVAPRLLEAASQRDVAATLIACNDLAQAGMDSNSVLAALLGITR